jgi:DNA-binding transcriptional LysR family regulator
MDTELLRTFLEVRRTRHFGLAAQNLFITQAAVSARIRQLAETVLVGLARARREVATSDLQQRHLQLVVRRGIWSAPIQERLHQLQREQPDLFLRIGSREPDAVAQMLQNRTADLALVYEPPNVPEIDSITIGDFVLRLYCSRRNVGLETAMAGRYVFLDWGSAFARFHRSHFGEAPVAQLHTNITELAIDYLAAGGGACFLPESSRRQLAGKGLYPVRGAPVFERQLNLVFPAGSPNLELIRDIASVFTGLRV